MSHLFPMGKYLYVHRTRNIAVMQEGTMGRVIEAQWVGG